MRLTFALCLASLFTAHLVAAQTVALAPGGTHPITHNGRVLWTEGQNPDALRLRLWDGTTTVTIDEAVAGARPGWHDLDEAGRVVYPKLVSGRYELMLWDGEQTRSLTNAGLPGPAVNLGSPAGGLWGGFPRIANGQVVFSDKDGTVYLYDGVRIRAITSGVGQRVARTTDGDRMSMQITGVKPLFEFDGRYITWKNQDPDGDASTFTIYQADARDGYRPRVISTFRAATPRGGNALVAGAAVDPFVTVCGPEIAWAYREPRSASAGVPAQYAAYAALAGDVILMHYDGSAVREVARGGVNPLTVRLNGGTLAWIEHEDDSRVNTNVRTRDLVRSYSGGGTPSTLAVYEEPPAQASDGDLFWTSPSGVEVQGSEVLWFADEKRCEPSVTVPGQGTLCAYMPTFRSGFFTRSGGASTPQRVFGEGEMLVGRFDSGRYVWTDTNGRILTTRLLSGGEGSGGLLLTDRLAPDRTVLGPDESRTRLLDRFALRGASGGECTGGQGGNTAEVTAVTFTVSAEAGVLPDLSDIVALRLYRDSNGNRLRDAGDPLLAAADPVLSRTRMVFAEPATILPGEDTLFLVEIEMKDADQLCPCNRYVVTLDGADVEASGVTAQGRTTGTLALPAIEFADIAGDAQTGLPGMVLVDPLGVLLEMPARCAVVAYTLRDVPGGDTPLLTAPDGSEGRTVEVPLIDTDDGAVAEARLRLGTDSPRYMVEAALLFPEGSSCEPPIVTFLAQAGSLVLQVIDANDPAFLESESDANHPDYQSWTVSLTDDLETLATGGEHRTKVSADGASPLLLRAQLLDFDEAPPGPVVFSLSGAGATGGLSPGQGETIPTVSGSLEVVTEWTLTSEGPIAVALYTPPRDFADASATGRQLTFTVTYEPAGGGEPIVEMQEAELLRPPVLFVHGMWSGPDTWAAPYRVADPRYDKFYADYSDKAAWNFATLGHVAEAAVQQVLTNRRQRGVATSQVDFVAHSMGGLIARQYMDDNNGLDYRRPDNFGQGDIHKFITMGTPHWGSPIAWLTLWLQNNEATQYTFLGYVDGLGIDIYSGAVDAMCPGSPQLQQLGPAYVPTHTIRAWHFDSSAPDFSWDTVYDFLWALWDAEPTPMALVAASLQFGGELAVETGLQGLFSSDKTDYLVTTDSQGGGIAPGINNLFEETMHAGAPTIYGETTSPEIAAYVFDLLEQPIDDPSIFATRLPAPLIDTSTPVTCAE